MTSKDAAEIIEALKVYREEYRDPTPDAGARLKQGQRLRARIQMFQLLDRATQDPAPEEAPKSGRNRGHGHVFPRLDGAKARCGGPGICRECNQDLAELRKGTRL